MGQTCRCGSNDWIHGCLWRISAPKSYRDAGGGYGHYCGVAPRLLNNPYNPCRSGYFEARDQLAERSSARCRPSRAPSPRPTRAPATNDVPQNIVRHPGDGIPEEIRPLLTQVNGAVELRRQRIPVAATGLSCAAYVLELHGGSLSIETGVDGVMEVDCNLGR